MIPEKGYKAVKQLYNKKNRVVQKRITPDLSICFGIRWLYYKTQLSGGNVKKGIYNYNGGGDPNYINKLKGHKKRELVKGW